LPLDGSILTELGKALKAQSWPSGFVEELKKTDKKRFRIRVEILTIEYSP
jgi:hypothetical protein